MEINFNFYSNSINEEVAILKPYLDMVSTIWEVSLNEKYPKNKNILHIELIDYSANYSFQNKTGTQHKLKIYDIAPISFSEICLLDKMAMKKFFFDFIYFKLVSYKDVLSLFDDVLTSIYSDILKNNITCEFKLLDGKLFKWQHDFYLKCTFEPNGICVFANFENFREEIVKLVPNKFIPYLLFQKAKIKDNLLLIEGANYTGVSIIYNLLAKKTEVNLLNQKDFNNYFL